LRLRWVRGDLRLAALRGAALGQQGLRRIEVVPELDRLARVRLPVTDYQPVRRGLDPCQHPSSRRARPWRKYPRGRLDDRDGHRRPGRTRSLAAGSSVIGSSVEAFPEFEDPPISHGHGGDDHAVDRDDDQHLRELDSMRSRAFGGQRPRARVYFWDRSSDDYRRHDPARRLNFPAIRTII